MLKKIKDRIRTRITSFLYYNFLPVVQNSIVMNLDYAMYQTRKKTKVVYTCLTGGYDALPLHEYLDYSWDYVCFTDNQNLLKMKRYGAWEIRPLLFSELDNQLNNRWHKTHPHKLFPDYNESIYIDSNISVLTSWLFDTIAEKNKDLVIPIHYGNDCIYDEIKTVLKYKLASVDSVNKMNDFLKAENFPHHYGLNENNIIFRRHHKKEIISINEEWWHFICDYTRRDQLSLAYVLWKHGIEPSKIGIPNLRKEYEHFCFYTHKK